MRGRPTRYTKRLGSEICRRLAEGLSLRRICEQPGMPALRTVMGWLFEEQHPDFSQQYARAREAQAEVLADEIIDVADEAVDRDSAAAAKVKVDARKWAASKLQPKKYGDRVAHELTGKNNGPIETSVVVVMPDNGRGDRDAD